MVTGRGKIGLTTRQEIDDTPSRLSRQKRKKLSAQQTQEDLERRQEFEAAQEKANEEAKKKYDAEVAAQRQAYMSEKINIGGQYFSRSSVQKAYEHLSRKAAGKKSVSLYQNDEARRAFEAILRTDPQARSSFNVGVGLSIAAREGGFSSTADFQESKAATGVGYTTRERELISGLSQEEFRRKGALIQVAQFQRQDIDLSPQEREGFIQKVVVEGKTPAIYEDPTGKKSFLNVEEERALKYQQDMDKVIQEQEQKVQEPYDPFKEFFKDKFAGVKAKVTPEKVKKVSEVMKFIRDPLKLQIVNTDALIAKYAWKGIKKVPKGIEFSLEKIYKVSEPVKIFPLIDIKDPSRSKLASFPEFSENVQKGLRTTGEISAKGWEDLLGTKVTFTGKEDVTTKKLVKSAFQRSIPFTAKAAPETIAWLTVPTVTATITASAASEKLARLDERIEKQVLKEIQTSKLSYTIPEEAEILKEYKLDRTTELTKSMKTAILFEGGVALGYLGIRGVTATTKFFTKEIPLRYRGGKVSKLKAIELKTPRGNIYRGVQVRTSRQLQYTTQFRKTFGFKPTRWETIQQAQVKVFTTPKFTKVGKPYLLEVRKLSRPPTTIRTTGQAFKLLRQGGRLGKAKEFIVFGKTQRLDAATFKQLFPTLSKKELTVFKALIKDPLKRGIRQGIKYRSDIYAISRKEAQTLLKFDVKYRLGRLQGFEKIKGTSKLLKGKIEFIKTRALTQEVVKTKNLVKAITKQTLFKSQYGKIGKVRTARTDLFILKKSVKSPFRVTGRNLNKELLANIDDIITRSNKGYVKNILQTPKGIGKGGQLFPRARTTTIKRTYTPDIILGTQETQALLKPTFLIAETSAVLAKQTSLTLSGVLPAVLSASISKQLPKTKQLIKTQIKQDTLIKQETLQKTQTKTLLKSITLPKLALKTFLSPPITITSPPTIPKTPKSPARIVRPLIFLPTALRPKAVMGGREAYSVQTKRRGVWKDVTKERFTRVGALSFGREVTDKSLAASFRINKTNTRKTLRDWNSYEGSYKFRSTTKKGKPLSFMGGIERKQFRLDTPTEIKKIRAAKLASMLLKKRSKKPFGYVSPKYLEPKLNFKGIPA